MTITTFPTATYVSTRNTWEEMDNHNQVQELVARRIGGNKHVLVESIMGTDEVFQGVFYAQEFTEHCVEIIAPDDDNDFQQEWISRDGIIAIKQTLSDGTVQLWTVTIVELEAGQDF